MIVEQKNYSTAATQRQFRRAGRTCALVAYLVYVLLLVAVRLVACLAGVQGRRIDKIPGSGADRPSGGKNTSEAPPMGADEAAWCKHSKRTRSTDTANISPNSRRTLRRTRRKNKFTSI